MSSNGKPTPQPAAGGAGGPPKMYQRPIYRPQQAPAKRRRGGRSCPFSCCCCFCWTVLVVVLLAVLAAVAGGAFYLLYRPHRPAFTLSAARVTRLSLSSSATAPALSDAIDVTLTARNPNKKLVYVYDDFAVTAATAANAVPLGAATAPGFAHEAGNVTVIRATVSASALAVDPAAAGSDVKRSGEFPIVLDLETRAGVRVGALKTKKIGILVHCDGVKVAAPAPAKGTKKKLAKAAAGAAPAPAAATATVARACQVRVRVKIWKWTF